ncbi:MAG: TolC family protein [Pseudomonadota bacterium]
MHPFVLLLASPALSMSLDDAVQAAHQVSPVTALSEARVAEAQAKVREATSMLLPTVTAGGATVWQNEVELDICYKMYEALAGMGQPVQPSMCDSVEPTLITPGQQWQAQVTGQEALVAPAAWLWRKAAREGAALAESEGAADRYQLDAAVLEAWHASARHHALLADAQAAQSLAEHIVGLADALVSNGVATRDQVLQAHAALSSARATVARATAAVAAADAALALVTGRNEAADGIAVPTSYPDLQQALASLDRPDLAMAGQRVDAARAVVGAERGAALPILGVTGKVYGLDPAPMVADDWNWQVQVGVTVPLVQGGKVLARLDGAKAQVQKAEAAKRLVLDQAKLEVIQTHGQLAAAMASLAEREEALRLSGEAVTAAEARLKEGGGSLLDLQQAQGGVAEAQVRLTLARADAAYQRDRLRQVTRGL